MYVVKKTIDKKKCANKRNRQTLDRHINKKLTKKKSKIDFDLLEGSFSSSCVMLKNLC